MTHRKASHQLQNLMKLAGITMGSNPTHTALIPKAQTVMDGAA